MIEDHNALNYIKILWDAVIPDDPIINQSKISCKKVAKSEKVSTKLLLPVKST